MAALDLKALQAEQWGKVSASMARMEKLLAPFEARARQATVHLIGHSHIDMDWQWTWKDTVHCIRRDFKAVTDMMDDYPDLAFSHSQPPTYEVVRNMDPKIFAKGEGTDCRRALGRTRRAHGWRATFTWPMARRWRGTFCMRRTGRRRT